MNNKKNLDKLIKEYNEYTVDSVFVEEILDDLNDLKKFYKPVVSQFIADWYEENKDKFEFNLLNYVYDFKKQESTSFKVWFTDCKSEPFKTLVNMHQFGYEVEKEKRYKVWLKNSSENTYLAFSIKTNKCFFTPLPAVIDTRETHTRKELEKANFGWVFDCEGIEIEELEDE